MPDNNEKFTLKDAFALVTNLPRATVIGAMYYCDRPLAKSRLIHTGATFVAGLAFGPVAAFAVAAGGLAFGGMAAQSFAQPLFGVPRTTNDELMGTKEALTILNRRRGSEGKAPLKFPKIDI